MRFGIVGEVINMALDSLKSHKLRSFLTLLGIIIGVTTVIGMVSIIQGLNRSFMANLESLGTNLIFIEKYEPGVRMGSMSEEERKRKDLTYEDALVLEEKCLTLEAVSATKYMRAERARFSNKEVRNPSIRGIDHRYHLVAASTAQEGRFFTEMEILRRKNVCLIGSEIANSLFPFIYGIGKKIIIDNHRFTVVGILEKRGKLFGQSQDDRILIPITTFEKFYPKRKYTSITAKPRKGTLIPEAMEEIINVLREKRRVPFGKPNDFAVFTQDTIVDLYKQITGAIYLVMIAISSIGLLVGGIGVMNIMLVSVRERTREIGIRKAIGARNSHILNQFLIEALALTGSGGIIGIILGFSLAFLVKAATPLPATVTFWSVILGFVVAVSVGLFFGIFPAQKAARLNPIEALRYE